VRDINELDILIVPGWHGSGPDHWQTHWEAAFPNMRRVEQDDWEAPVYADWSRKLTEAVGRCKRPVVLIGHSLGNALITRWAHEPGIGRIDGAFLVATSDIDRFVGTPGYTVRGFDPMVMRRLPFPSMVLASCDDERVSLERARAFASAWVSRFAEVGALGHIGSDAKLGLWPQGLVLLGQFIASLG
jgi:uncharacterized protein